MTGIKHKGHEEREGPQRAHVLREPKSNLMGYWWRVRVPSVVMLRSM